MRGTDDRFFFDTIFLKIYPLMPISYVHIDLNGEEGDRPMRVRERENARGRDVNGSSIGIRQIYYHYATSGTADLFAPSFSLLFLPFVKSRKMRPISPPPPTTIDHAPLQKEKDLELAAKIGQSLLEQNRDLQARTEFLEEQLIASNDAVVQLRHELQMKMNLLHVYADTDDLDSCSDSMTPTRAERRANVELLQQRMQALEQENTNLKMEVSYVERVVVVIDGELLGDTFEKVDLWIGAERATVDNRLCTPAGSVE